MSSIIQNSLTHISTAYLSSPTYLVVLSCHLSTDTVKIIFVK